MVLSGARPKGARQATGRGPGSADAKPHDAYPLPVSFQTVAVGPVSVQDFDPFGRRARQLHDGPVPNGEFGLP